MNKKNWHQYFMEITEKVSEKATCNRKHVGAIIIKDKRILATGFNGSIAGGLDCDESYHMMDGGHCVRTVHAELNAIVQCAKYGISCDGASMYINTFPCWSCFKTIVNAGIKKIYYKDDYEAHMRGNVQAVAIELGIELEQL